MKKVFAIIGSASAFLAAAPFAFAADLDPCTSGNVTGILKATCNAKTFSLGSIIGFIISIVFVIAILAALLFLVWGGIKWITSGGDKAGVEGARNQIIAAIIGLIIVFLAFFILNLVLGLFGMSIFNLDLPTLK